MRKKKIVENIERSYFDYFNELKKLCPLSREEEFSLWEKYKKNNDIEARNTIIKSNLKFVASVAKPYIGMGLSYQDLISEGNIGLIKSIDKFDYNKGYKTISYSVWWIRQTIMEALKKRNKLKFDDIQTAVPDTNDEDMENDDMLISNYVDNSNSEKINNDENSFVINKLINVLNEREKYIISSYFGLNNKEKTLEEIGKELNLTKERIRQIKELALKKLRTEALMQNLTINGFLY